jgi:hypothetical protein
MNFRVLYTILSDNHETIYESEWICPSGYNTDRAIQSFKRQFPSAAVIQIRPLEELPTPDTTTTGR